MPVNSRNRSSASGPRAEPISVGSTFAKPRCARSWSGASTSGDRGFGGLLFAGVDGSARHSGFDLTAEQQLAFNRWLAEVAHARGLAAGIINDLDQAAELANAFDFLVADTCIDQGNCAAVQPFLAAHKPVFLLDYTNVARRMNEHCAAAMKIGAPLVFKTQYLNGKLHRRCP